MLNQLSLVSSHTHLIFEGTVRGILCNWNERVGGGVDTVLKPGVVLYVIL